MTYEIYSFKTCKFCGQDRKTNRYGFCGKCWSQLEKIESDGDILYVWTKAYVHFHKMINAIEEMMSLGLYPKDKIMRGIS